MIKYGKGICIIKYSTDILKSVVIKYRGNPRLKHNHLSLDAMLGGDSVLIKNYGSKNLLIQGNNQIHIGFINGAEEEFELFRYTGLFKILSVKVNDKNIKITEMNIDYWNKIDSTWNTAGKPEQYKYNYQFGRGLKNKKSKLSKKLIKSRSNKTKRGY
jgi:hypothetical protein